MNILSLLLCEDVRKELTGAHTIVGQFGTLRGYIGEKYTFKVFFAISAYTGMAKLKVVVRSPEGVELKRFLTDDIPCVDKRDHYAGYFTINNLLLRSYGKYTVHLYDVNDNELAVINMNYLVPNFQTNTLMINGSEVEVPRVNFHDRAELQNFAKLFLRKYRPLSSRYESIEFHSQFVRSDGIGSVSCHIVDEMVKRGVKVNCVPVYADPESKRYVENIPVDNKYTGDADITIVNTLPPHLKNACNSKRLLLFSYWEASKIDQSWVNVANTTDALFVPSQYVKNVYKSSGVRVPIIVYRQPIDPLFVYKDKDKVENKKYFDILFIGTCIKRKGIDVFTKAIDKVFGNDPKVRVRVHTKPWNSSLGDFRGDLVKKYSGNKQYFITINNYETKEIVDLIQSCDLLVAPSRSEGLGLIPIQSVICGTPAIVPDNSGFMEYNNNPGFLKIGTGKVVKGEGIYEKGSWFEPDFDKLCEQLVFARENIEGIQADAKMGSKILGEMYGVSSTYLALEALINNIYVNK